MGDCACFRSNHRTNLVPFPTGPMVVNIGQYVVLAAANMKVC